MIKQNTLLLISSILISQAVCGYFATLNDAFDAPVSQYFGVNAGSAL